jgi:hypothetical protein
MTGPYREPSAPPKTFADELAELSKETQHRVIEFTKETYTGIVRPLLRKYAQEWPQEWVAESDLVEAIDINLEDLFPRMDTGDRKLDLPTLRKNLAADGLEFNSGLSAWGWGKVAESWRARKKEEKTR